MKTSRHKIHFSQGEDIATKTDPKEYRLKCAETLYLVQERQCDSFRAQLFRLMWKADCFNFERLRSAFPVEVGIWEEYMDAEKPGDFYEKYGLG